jgi:hypothetical protein
MKLDVSHQARMQLLLRIYITATETSENAKALDILESTEIVLLIPPLLITVHTLRSCTSAYQDQKRKIGVHIVL